MSRLVTRVCRAALALLPLPLALLFLATAATGCRSLRPDALVLPPPPVQPPGPRQVVFVSDLHMGLGERAPGQYDPYEDFRWSAELAQFLTAIAAQGGGATDLVLNGDSFELWQSRRGDCEDPDPDLGCSEAEATDRFTQVLRAHAADLRALGDFARAGDNRVFFVPGNHDAALLLPGVAAALVQAIAAPAGRVQVASAGYFLSADGRIFAEHGHQIGLDGANQLTGWPKPFIDRAGTRYLRRPWGEQFMRFFFNRYEDPYPILDNILLLSDAARYGLASEQLAGGAAAAQVFLDLALQQTSAAQGRDLLWPSLGVPRWDLARIRAAGDWLLGPQVLPAGDLLAAAVARAQAAGRLGRTVAALTDSQIVRLCDQRAILDALRTAGQGPAPAACPPVGSLAAAAATLVAERDSVLADRVTALRQGLRRQLGLSAAIDLFVYSHTHVPEAPFRPQRGVQPPLVANTGAFQRTASGAWLDAERARRGLTVPATLPALRPEDLAPCYSFVRVPAYPPASAPQPELRSFRRADGTWRIEDGGCPAS